MTVRRRLVRLWCLLAALAVIALGRPALAQTPDETNRRVARELADEGARLFEEGVFDAALDRFERADAIMHVPTLGLRVARCLVQLGRLVEASERYTAVERMMLPPDPQGIHARAREDAAAENELLSARLPRVRIEVQGAGDDLVIEIDGKVLPGVALGRAVPMNPGAHTIVARSGGRSESATITATEGEKLQASLVFDPPVAKAVELIPPPRDVPAPRAAPPHDDGNDALAITGFTGIGVGAAALVTGSVLGGLLLSRRSDLESSGCGEDLSTCPPSVTDDAIDGYNALRVPTTALLVTGSVVTSLGIVLAAVAPATKTEVVVTGTGLAVRGSF